MSKQNPTNVNSNIDITNILANLCVSDTCHDFNSVISVSKFNENSSIQDAYKEGLYKKDATNNYKINALDENDALKSIIKNVKSEDEYLFKINNIEQKKKGLTTINGKIYEVKHCVGKISKDKFITAEEFIKQLDINNHSGFVVDAASISINSILQNKKKDFDFQIYYLMNSEIINDPATKTPLYSSEFNNSVYIPCEPVNDGTKTYSYSSNHINGYNDNFPIAENSFFTKYKFQLSGLNFTDKNTKWSTNLLIFDNNKNVDSVTSTGYYAKKSFFKSILNTSDKIEDDNDAVNNNAISKLLESVGTFFNSLKLKKPQKLKNNDIINLNTKIQQKRSGDWLQVLSCLSVRSRKYKKYDLLKKDQKEINIQDVYFVTHDRIAMTFALLMGVNVIFTHIEKDENNKSYSIYSYKLKDETQLIESRKIQAIEIKNKIKNADYDKKIEDILKKIKDYNNTFYTNFINEPLKNIREFTKKIEDANLNNILNTNNVKDLTNNIRELFQNAYQYCHYKNIFKDLNSEYINYFLPEVKRLKNINADKDENNKLIIDIYNNIESSYDDCKSALELYTSYDPNKIKKEFIKTKYYSIIEKWDLSADTKMSKRIWSFLWEKKEFQMDKNLFLYHLENVPINEKKGMNMAFKEINKKIIEILKNDKNKEIQWINILHVFCIEVFVNFETKEEELGENYQTIEIDEESNLSENVIIESYQELNKIADVVADDEPEPEPDNIEIQIEDDHRKITYDLLTVDVKRRPNIMNYVRNNTMSLFRLIKNNKESDDLREKVTNKKRRRGGTSGSLLGKKRGGNENEELMFQSKYNKNSNLLHASFQYLCFHPFIPIYMILISYQLFVSSNIEESLDYSIYLYYFALLNNIIHHLDIVCKEDPLKAYIIGISLRDILFNGDILTNTEIFERILGFSPIPEKYRHLVPDYSLINGLNIQLSYFISGKIYTSEDTEDALLLLQTDMVSSFLKEVMNIEHVNDDIKSNELYNNSSKLLEKIGNIIILDRTTIIPNKQTNVGIQGLTDNEKERMKTKLELQNQNYLEKQRQTSHKTQKKSLRPFDRSRIIPFSQIRPINIEGDGEVLNTTIKNKSVAKGGKKSRRTRKNKRNKKEVK
jgi:hypothetical protein